MTPTPGNPPRGASVAPAAGRLSGTFTPSQPAAGLCLQAGLEPRVGAKATHELLHLALHLSPAQSRAPGHRLVRRAGVELGEGLPLLLGVYVGVRILALHRRRPAS